MDKKNQIITESMRQNKATCPVCGSIELLEFLEIGDIPVHCNRLWPTRETALCAPKADIRLSFCCACGHVFNATFDPSCMTYNQAYENSLHFSPHFQEYAESLAKRLIENHGLYHKDVIEIGCGKGDFLNLLCELGENHGVGFDPSYDPKRADSTLGDRFTIVQDFYSERYANYEADLICCRHVLEHIQFPLDFVSTIRRTIGNRIDTILFFEVPNVMFSLGDLGIWDLIYEHCGYFSELSLAHLFNSCGFLEKSLTCEFGGQFLCIDALPSRDQPAPKSNSAEGVKRVMEHVVTFSQRYSRKIERWESHLEEMRNAGERVVIWGAGSKGVTFLNTLRLQQHIQYVVDINPHKTGMYIPGTGQKIVHPDFLRNYRPHKVITMNPIYLQEIEGLVTKMHLSADLISA